MTTCKNPENTTSQAVSASFQSKIIFQWRSEAQTFSPDFSLSSTLCASTECLQSVKCLKKLGFQHESGRGGGYVIGSYTSLGFRALRKDVVWKLAETAEHLSSY